MSPLTGESLPVVASAELDDADRRRCSRRATSSSAARPAPAARRRPLVFATGMHTELGPHRRAVPAGRGRGEPAGAPGPARRLADRARRGRGRRRVPADRHGSSRACRSTTRSSSRSACSSRTSPRACCRRSRWRWPSASGGSPAAARSSSGCRAVETLGSTDRDLHRQDRHADREPDARGRVWTPLGERRPRGDGDRAAAGRARPRASAAAIAACSNAELDADGDGRSRGDPTEIALLRRARALGVDVAADADASTGGGRCSASTRAAS